jgi:hypothetical protein
MKQVHVRKGLSIDNGEKNSKKIDNEVEVTVIAITHPLNRLT